MIDSLIGSASQNWVDSTSHYWASYGLEIRVANFDLKFLLLAFDVVTAFFLCSNIISVCKTIKIMNIRSPLTTIIFISNKAKVLKKISYTKH